MTFDLTHTHRFYILVFLEDNWNYWAQNASIPSFLDSIRLQFNFLVLYHKNKGKKLSKDNIYLSTLSFLYSGKSEVGMFPVCIYTIYSQLGKFKRSIKGFCTNPYYNGVHRNRNAFYHFFSKAIFTKKWNANILNTHLMKGHKIKLTKQLKYKMKQAIK